ncbi:hypothetical protein RKE29_28820, partial [Streptomyces sp. B1866]|nr:hypothetical protein [Streptomyces sp. B1866]
MEHGQLPDPVEEFARFLRALTGRLDPTAGWYGVFAQRDPDGMRACLGGQEVPPWDVVQALLQDFSALCGHTAAQDAAVRAADLYRASVSAYDAAGDAATLRGRLDVMLGERTYAATRERHLRQALLAAADAAVRERLAADLAWAHDDWERATARCDELRTRLSALDRRRAAGRPGPVPYVPAQPGPGPADDGRRGPGQTLPRQAGLGPGAPGEAAQAGSDPAVRARPGPV